MDSTGIVRMQYQIQSIICLTRLRNYNRDLYLEENKSWLIGDFMTLPIINPFTHWWLHNTLINQPIHDYSARPSCVLTISVTGQLKPKLMSHSWHQPIHDICILTIPVTGRLKPKLMTHSWLVTMSMWPKYYLTLMSYFRWMVDLGMIEAH